MNFDRDDGSVYLVTSFGSMNAVFASTYSISHEVSIMGSPGEEGMMNFDHKVRQPTTVRITGLVMKASYNDLAHARKSIEDGTLNNSLCQFYGREETVVDLIITRLVGRASTDHFDAIEVEIELKEFMGIG